MATNNNQLIDSLKKCRVDGNVVHLPKEHLSNYSDVRKALMNAGAKYKSNTFVFTSTADSFMSRLIEGDSVNIKKEFQYFPTPPDIAMFLVELAKIEKHNLILEPSAGQGSIINCITEQHSESIVFAFELMNENRMFLSNINKCVLIGDDFLKNNFEIRETFDVIIANPPFSKNQDIDHILQMYNYLAPGGRIVSVASKHWQFANDKKSVSFREFIKNNYCRVHEIDSGRFKNSGTMIATCIVVIDKPIN